MEKEDAYLKLLRLAREDFQLQRGIRHEDLMKRIKEVGMETQTNHILRDIYNPFHAPTGGVPEHHFMNLQAYMQLLQYDELNQARTDSKEARRHSNIAIAIAVVAILVDIAFGIWQTVYE